MAAYAALVSLLNNIRTITNHPRFSSSLDNEQIQPLLEKTNFLIDFIEGNHYGGGSKEAEDLERQIASAAHAAEDLIESNIVYRINRARFRFPYVLNFLLNYMVFHVSHRSKNTLHQINEKMDALMKEANEFKEKRRLGMEPLPTRLAVAGPLRDSGETAMVGLDAELNQLLDELTGYQSCRRIISIVGMGGTGKSTLAKNIYKNLLIKEKFQFRAWATLSQRNNAQEVLLKLLSGLGEVSSGTADDLGVQLHKTLSGRRYLIVLDDIWSVKDWDEVRRFFPDNNNASRILLTTRLSNVAKDCGSSLVKMNLLDEENSWKLFCEKAFQKDDFPLKLRKVGEEIVQLCKGLALSIVVIGGLLLKSPRTVEYWKEVANALKLIPNSKEKQETLDVLYLSYNHLPPHLKPCFLYMGVFKEDSEIRVSRLIRLWIAEGFIKPNGSRVLEEIADGYVKDLIDRNLIVVGRFRKYGKFGSCNIHDLLRDLCIKIAEQEEFFHANKSETQGTERRLVRHWNLEPMKVGFPLTRSIMVEEQIWKPVKYRLLRVLDAGRCYSPANYCGNVNLRYLTYQCNHGFPDLWKLPSSLSLMWNFQTLTIVRDDRCTIVVAPIEFWKMRQLRHVECFSIHVPCPPPRNKQDELLMLENLQTLKLVLNLRLCEEVCRIISNIKKLHMDYDPDFQGHDDSLIESLCNLDRLHKLESLRLNMHYSGMKPNPNSERNKKLTTSFPSSLKRLSLMRCGLHWKDLEVIGLLPHLEVLKLQYTAVIGGNWSPVSGQFRRLKFLEILLCDLASWDADASHFPVLETLFLRRLRSLEEIPLDIGDIPTLALVNVAHCSNSTAISAVKLKEDHVDDEDLQVEVFMYESQLDSFDQILETEGLTTRNIQLEIW